MLCGVSFPGQEAIESLVGWVSCLDGPLQGGSPHCTDGETEPQRGVLRGPRPHSQETGGLELEPRSL